MIEPEAVIDAEAVPPAHPVRRHRRAGVTAGVTLLAVVTGGLAVAFDGGRRDAEPLALMAGDGAAGGRQTMAAADAKSPGAPAVATPEASRAALYPYGGWGLTFEVDGDLPELADRAEAWRVNGPSLARADVVRIAEVLGVSGTPVQRDGGWFVEGGDWTLGASGGDAMGKGGVRYLNLYRNRYDGRPDDAAGDTPAGPAISRADAERRVLDLLDRIGAPKAAWKVDTTETDIGTGWACAAPPELTAEEAKKLEANKLGQIEPAAGIAAPCPPPPPAVKGFNVSLSPVLDGRRADWPVWNVTMRSDGRIENLYGSWVNFERGGGYKLRGVEAALKELQTPPVAYATDSPAPTVDGAPAVAVQSAAETVAASGTASGSTGAGASGPSLVDPETAVDLPADAPLCPPMPTPLPAQEDKGTSSMPAMTCAPPAPQVVKIGGVELGLLQTSVFEDGQVRLALVPAYRFTGHYDNGTRWETSVLALHPDAIAPPPTSSKRLSFNTR